MTATQKFIEDAVKGGWKYSCTPDAFSQNGDGMTCRYGGCNSEWSVWIRDDNDSSLCVSHSDTLWRPEVWHAVGKVRGWDKRVTVYVDFLHGKDNYDAWRIEMHRLIDALADGKSIEDYLSTI